MKLMINDLMLNTFAHTLIKSTKSNLRQETSLLQLSTFKYRLVIVLLDAEDVW